jgi:hypothetical protein
MKLHEVQAKMAELIAANEALAAFGAPLVFTLFTDDKTVRETIATRLREKGVVLEVGAVDAARSPDTSVRGVAADASFDVFIAESPTVEHTPSGEDLRRTIIEVLMQPTDRHTPRAEFSRSESAISEQGYVLHIISFTQRVTIP